jgi:hypothetical protein
LKGGDFLRIGKIRIKTLRKFLRLCNLTFQEYRLPTVWEIMERLSCCRSNAYNYLRALRYLFSEEALEKARREAERNRSSVQTTIQQTLA